MTRITNIGFKRTYVQATNPNSVDLPPAIELGQQPKSQAESKSKKRKRAEVDTLIEGETASKSKGDDEQRRKKKKKSIKNGGPGASQTVGQTWEEPWTVEGTASLRLATKNRPSLSKDAHSRAISAEQRRLKRIEERTSALICFACRQPGHSIRDCPSASRQSQKANVCYRCGSNKHTLSRCPRPAKSGDPLPFAKCFVCGGEGHLAGRCPQNQDKGIYPNGGACKLCGDNTHLARDCGLRNTDALGEALVLGISRVSGADEDDFHALKRTKALVDKEEKAVRRIAGTGGGDQAKPKKVVTF